MALRVAGSQNCPIDIEDEDTVLVPQPQKKRKIEKVHEDEIEIIAVGNTCERPMGKKPKKESKQSKTFKGSPFASKKSLEALHEKFKSLESRLKSLENCIGRVSQVFFNSSLSLDPCTADIENSDVGGPAITVQDIENSPEPELEYVNGSSKQDSINDILSDHDREPCNKYQNCGASSTVEKIQHTEPENDKEASATNSNELENSDASSTLEIIQDIISQNDTATSVTNQDSNLNKFENHDASATIRIIEPSINLNDTETFFTNLTSSSCFENHNASGTGGIIRHITSQNVAVTSGTIQASNLSEFEHHDAAATSENIYRNSRQNGAEASVINQASELETATSGPLQETSKQSYGANDNEEAMVEDEQIDSKWHLVDLVSVKREVALHRDDQGRVLMFLSCAFKKLYKPVPGIAATSGVYLGDEFKNEYNFVSNRRLSDVKIEAEIRAAWFGIELVKGLYSNSARKVCLMVISSCQPLVKLMKERSFSVVYPKFYSCSCENPECNHSETRWNSSHPLGGSQRDVLPKLIMCMRDLRVHWCHVDNISDEEKKILEKYSLEVLKSLNDYVALKTRNR